MKQYYELKIKPLNDQLGRDLGINTIEVDYTPLEHYIPVRVFMPKANKSLDTRKIRFLRSLGLSL